MPRGKYGKPTRGGGKKFSRDLKPLDDTPGMWDASKEEGEGESSSEEEEDEDEEEEESDSDSKPTTGSSSTAGKQPAIPVITADMTRDERRAAQKAVKEAKRNKAPAPTFPDNASDEDAEEEAEAEVPKPKQPKAAAKGFDVNNLNSQGAEAAPSMSRREREVVEAAAAKERYRKLHEAGKTDEAKADLARLALIKQERAEKAKQRAAELEEKKRQAEIKALASGKRK